MGLGLQNMKAVDQWIPLVKRINVCEHIISGRKRTVSSRWTRARDSCPIFLDPVSSGTIIMVSMLLKEFYFVLWRLMLTIESGFDSFEIRSRTSRTAVTADIDIDQ